MLSIHGQLTEKDYLQAQQLHMQLSGWARLVPYITTILCVIGFSLAGLKATTGNFSFFLLLLPAMMLILTTPLTNYLLLPRQIKRLFGQNKEISAPQQIEFSAKGMKLSNSFGQSERAWSHFVKWKEDEQGFLLYHSDLAFNAIPKRFFNEAESIDFVRQQLQQHAVPMAGTTWTILNIKLLTLIIVLFVVGSMIMQWMR